MNTDIVLSRDLVNPFIEIQKQKLEFDKKTTRISIWGYTIIVTEEQTQDLLI